MGVPHHRLCETPENGITASRPVPFKVRRFQVMSIVSSLHGMVCVALSNKAGHNYNNFENSELILWNPCTGDYKTLSRAGSHSDCYEEFGNRFGLYYSSSKDDYMLVCVTYHPNVYIYTLKSDSWRKVESTGWSSSSSRLSYLLVTSVLFNEKLYFLHKPDFSYRSYSLITFDTQTEKLRDITTPHSTNQWTHDLGFMVVRDCIHFCGAIKHSVDQHYTIKVWRMDGDGDWTMVETSSLKEHLFTYHNPKHLMRNGNWLEYSRSEEGIYVLDTKKQTKEFMCSIGIAFRPAGKYIETIVSPNQYLK